MTSDIASHVPFARLLGISTDMTSTGIAAKLPENADYLNHVGSVHAGALYSVGETATGALLPRHFLDLLAQATAVVRKSEIEFHRPARGAVTATAALGEAEADIRCRLAANERCDFKAIAELRDSEDTHVATISVEWHVRLRK